METQEAILEVDPSQRTNDLISIFQGLGWMTTVFNESLFDNFWKNTTEGHEISKLRSYQTDLRKDFDHYFPVAKKISLSVSVDGFIKIYENYQHVSSFQKKLYIYPLRAQGKRVFSQAVELLACYYTIKDV